MRVALAVRVIFASVVRSRALSAAALAIVSALVCPLRAEAQVLVKDISPNADTVFGQFENYNGLLVFVANGTLWRSDGTEVGTTQVSTARVDSPTFAMVNGVALFQSYDQQAGYELWRSDLTPGGTYQLVDLMANGSSGPRDFVRAGSYVYFLANLNASKQLWRSDGTAGGTVLLRTFSAADGDPSNLVAVGNRVFFDTFATNGVASVWRADGTPAGTVMLRAFPDGQQGLLYRSVRSSLGIGNTFYFAHYTAAEGVELWKSDGTVGGTVLVSDTIPGPTSNLLTQFTDWSGTLAFVAMPEDGDQNANVIWRSQGTGPTTAVVDPAANVLLSYLHVFAGDLFFTGDKNNDPGMYRTDGTAVGTVKISNATFNTISQLRRGASAVVNGVLYFSGASFFSTDIELWRTDGTPGGTTRVADIWLGTTGSWPGTLTNAGGALYFAASDGITGAELYRVGLPTITLPPNSLPDAFSTAFNTTLVVAGPGVLTNDAANGGGALTAALDTAVPSGTLVLQPNGGFTFTPAAGFTGTATFTYHAVSANGAGNVATVTITVTGPPPQPPTSAPDAFSTLMGTPLTVAIPGVLANDNSNGGGAMTAAVATSVAHGTLNFNAGGGFVYTPVAGYTGPDQFTYRASNAGGAGAETLVTLAVQAVGVQPPTGLYTYRASGNTITVRWTAPANGPTPTGYIFEGGATPGQVLASLPTESTAPIYTLAAPTGSYYVRIRTVAGAATSAPSNEVQIYPGMGRRGGGTPAPAPPRFAVGVGNNQSLGLAWRDSFEGGEPTNVILDVDGTLSASLSLGAVSSFTFDGVPPGTYTFRLRAQNDGGTTVPSNPVTLTFPATCTGVPAPPDNFLAYRTGNVVSVVWDPAATGAASTSFVLAVSGSVNAALPLTSRSISSPVPPGSYTFSVAAVNACGTSAPTAPRTVVVP